MERWKLIVKYLSERNLYRRQAEQLKQRERLQQENDEIQRSRYAEAMSILHDVNKHIAVIESLYQAGQKSAAVSYTAQIQEKLRPFTPFPYGNNPILDCLLTERARQAEKNHISFNVKISPVDINFMKPIDITTLFGNLLDNAINACKKCGQDAYINFFMHPQNEMVSIRVENSTDGTVPVSGGRIAPGLWNIGLMNIQHCIESYNGSIIYHSRKEVLICDILINRNEE